MGKPKTDYDADNYNRNSLANIMQFITADMMIRHDIEGAEAFMEFQPQIVKLRRKILHAHSLYSKMKKYGIVSQANVAEGVLLYLRDGHDFDDVFGLSNKKLYLLHELAGD